MTPTHVRNTAQRSDRAQSTDEPSSQSLFSLQITQRTRPILLFLAVATQGCDLHTTFQICFSLSHHANLKINLTHDTINPISNVLEVLSAVKEEEGPVLLTWPEDSFSVRSCLHASLETTCFLWASPNQRQCSLDSIKKRMLTPSHHGQCNDGEGRMEAFSPLVNPCLHPAVLYMLILKLSQVVTGRYRVLDL